MIEDLRLEPAGSERHELEESASRRREPGDAGEHGVAHSGRHRPVGRREDLADVEGIAAGDAMEPIRRDRGPRGQLRDARRGKGRNVDADAPGRRREIAEQDTQAMGLAELVVPVGDEHETA